MQPDNSARSSGHRGARTLGRAAAGERDPAAAAAEAEFAASIVAVRLELGSPYREVLDLHLGEGMNAKEIALRLGRPAGTVRTQLVRALELLLQRLPNGLVAGARAAGWAGFLDRRAMPAALLP